MKTTFFRYFFFILYFFSFLSDLILDKLINDKYSYFDLLGKLNEAFLKVKFRFAEKTAKSGRKWNSDRRKLRSSGSLITLNSIYWKNLNEHDEQFWPIINIFKICYCIFCRDIMLRIKHGYDFKKRWYLKANFPCSHFIA